MKHMGHKTITYRIATIRVNVGSSIMTLDPVCSVSLVRLHKITPNVSLPNLLEMTAKIVSFFLSFYGIETLFCSGPF